MVCPKDNNQCVQFEGIGAGQSDHDFYDTAELKQCPACKSVYLEYYCTFELGKNSENHVARLKDTIKKLILQWLEKSVRNS